MLPANGHRIKSYASAQNLADVSESQATESMLECVGSAPRSLAQVLCAVGDVQKAPRTAALQFRGRKANNPNASDPTPHDTSC